MQNIKVPEEIIDKLQILEQRLESIGIDVESFENILGRMIDLMADIKRVDSSDKYNYLPLFLVNERRIEVYSWNARVYLGDLNTECTEREPIIQCLRMFLQDKARIYERLMEMLAKELDLIISWISDNKEKITRLDEIKDKVNEIYRTIKQSEDEEE